MSNCAVNVENLSKSLCSPKYGQIRKVWLDPNDTGVTLVNALLQATWTTKVNATESSRMYVLNENPQDATWTFGEPAIVEGNTQLRKKANDGTQRLMLTYTNLSLCKARAIKQLDNISKYAYFITANEYIMAGGTETQLKPVEVMIFVDEPRPQETNSDLWKTNVYIDIIPTSEIWLNAVDPYTANGWRPSNIDGLNYVLFSNIAADISAKTVIFDASTLCDGTDVTALTTVGDFIVRVKSTGVALTLSTITWVGNTGTITVDNGTPLTAVDHEILLVGQPTATVKGYETKAAITFLPVA